ncbi:MAG: FecR domain-containing protein [Fulvivirga sp.]|uniref:FecR family protein n=1 Tax=Fulvivirga sp. TaxID=1931237 RepID=UPI0032ECD2EF
MNFEKFENFLKKKESSGEEINVSEVISWIHSEEAKDVVQQKLIDEVEEGDEPDVDFDDLYTIILDKIKHREISRPTFRQISLNPRHGRKYYHRMIKIAAVLIVLLSVSFILSHLLDYSTDRIPHSQIDNPVIKRTSAGEKLNIQLSDGTRIKLNGRSAITYDQASFQKQRHVILEGEAFFEVARMEENPFTVEIKDGIEVTVLGTSFIVDVSGSDEGIVAVKSGKVSVRSAHNDQTVVLSQNELARYSEFQPLSKDVITNGDIYFGWVENRLVLKDASFHQVLVTIKRWYGYEIEASLDYSKFDNYTAVLTNPTLKELMESLSHIYKFKYNIDEQSKKIVIRKSN